MGGGGKLICIPRDHYVTKMFTSHKHDDGCCSSALLVERNRKISGTSLTSEGAFSRKMNF